MKWIGYLMAFDTSGDIIIRKRIVRPSHVYRRSMPELIVDENGKTVAHIPNTGTDIVRSNAAGNPSDRGAWTYTPFGYSRRSSP